MELRGSVEFGANASKLWIESSECNLSECARRPTLSRLHSEPLKLCSGACPSVRRRDDSPTGHAAISEQERSQSQPVDPVTPPSRTYFGRDEHSETSSGNACCCPAPTGEQGTLRFFCCASARFWPGQCRGLARRGLEAPEATRCEFSHHVVQRGISKRQCSAGR